MHTDPLTNTNRHNTTTEKPTEPEPICERTQQHKNTTHRKQHNEHCKEEDGSGEAFQLDLNESKGRDAVPTVPHHRQDEIKTNFLVETVDFCYETLRNITWYKMLIHSNDKQINRKMPFIFFEFGQRHNELCTALTTAQRKKQASTITAVENLLTQTVTIISDPTKRTDQQQWRNLNTDSIIQALTTPEYAMQLAQAPLLRQTAQYISRQSNEHEPDEDEQQEETDDEAEPDDGDYDDEDGDDETKYVTNQAETMKHPDHVDDQDNDQDIQTEEDYEDRDYGDYEDYGDEDYVDYEEGDNEGDNEHETADFSSPTHHSPLM